MIMRTINNMNLAAALLHFALAIMSIVWWLAVFKDDDTPSLVRTDLYGVRTTIYDAGHVPNDAGPVPNDDGTTITYKLVQYVPHSHWLNIVLIVLFFLITAVFHTFYYTCTNMYTGMLNNKLQWLRWVEYGMSATIMVCLIAFSVGCKMCVELVVAAVATILLMFMGFLVEYASAAGGHMPKLLCAVGWILFVLVWFILGQGFYSSVRSADGNIPGFVYAIVSSMFLFFALFGLVQSLYVGHVLKDYVRMEGAYLVLSFVSKATLGMLLLGGQMNRRQPSKVES